MKYNKWIGLAACVLLTIACFMPWAYYADIGKNFTGFFSQGNAYGKPGKFLCFFAIASCILILIHKIWAKRTHLFLAALFTGYAIKSYILFTSCYNTFCPEKRFGIYLMLGSCLLILLLAIFPDMKISEDKKV